MRWTNTSGASLDCLRRDGKSPEKSQQMGCVCVGGGVTGCISVEKGTNMSGFPSS